MASMQSVRAARVARRWSPLLLALLAPGGAAHAEKQAGRLCTLTIDMSGFHSDKGLALVGLYGSSKGFPDSPEAAIRRVPVSIRDGKARALLRQLPAGTYAVGVLHDEDGDRRMKTGMFGRPKEGYGASRDARGRFGPPRFDDARLTLRPGQSLRAPIKIVYH